MFVANGPWMIFCPVTYIINNRVTEKLAPSLQRLWCQRCGRCSAGGPFQFNLPSSRTHQSVTSGSWGVIINHEILYRLTLRTEVIAGF